MVTTRSQRRAFNSHAKNAFKQWKSYARNKKNARTSAVKTGVKNMFQAAKSAYKVHKHMGGPKKAATKNRVTEGTGASLRQPTTMTHKNKRVRFNNKKDIKVTSNFKNKVKKALDGINMHGTFTTISQGFLDVKAVATNQQGVQPLFQNTGDYSVWCFDPEVMLHMVSVLWNHKADAQASRALGDTNNFGNIQSTTHGTIPIGNESSAGTQTASVGQNPLNVKYTLKNAYELVRMKNNTFRTVTLKIYIVAPKINAAFTTPTFQRGIGAGPSTVVNTDYIGNPSLQWNACLSDQYNAGVNIANSVYTDIYQSPLFSPEMKAIYNLEEHIFVLEPGQTADLKIQGPKNFDIDYNKFFRSNNTSLGQYMGIQKFMRYPMAVYYNDLAFGNTSGFGRFPGTIGLLNIERQMHYSFSMPDLAGATVSLGNGTSQTSTIQNNLRRNAYFYDVYNGTAATGTVTRVDENEVISNFNVAGNPV